MEAGSDDMDMERRSCGQRGNEASDVAESAAGHMTHVVLLPSPKYIGDSFRTTRCTLLVLQTPAVVPGKPVLSAVGSSIDLANTQGSDSLSYTGLV